MPYLYMDEREVMKMPYIERRTTHTDGVIVERYYSSRTNTKRKPARETGKATTHKQSK